MYMMNIAIGRNEIPEFKQINDPITVEVGSKIFDHLKSGTKIEEQLFLQQKGNEISFTRG